MKTIRMYFLFIKIGREKGKILVFHVIFLNKNISITGLDIVLQFLMPVLHTHPEGSMSQIFYLGPSFYFMHLTK